MAVDVFVSSENIAVGRAADLVRALLKKGLSVTHSPPWDQESNWAGPWNSDWDAWYGPNLWHSAEEARLIILVVSDLWQSSTWMLAECEAATKAAAMVDYSKVLIWNPEEVPITNPNFTRHLGEELPLSLDELLKSVVSKLQSSIPRNRGSSRI
jgi:hypothetical protein